MSATLERSPAPHPDTIAIHGGHSGDPATKARTIEDKRDIIADLAQALA